MTSFNVITGEKERLRGKEADKARGVVEDWERPVIILKKKEVEMWELWSE